eukprot:CAMPEP_0170593840 /NCGR_PEP_ID=MMETSP0224-20130122/13678_1 /TAXON_ID=285029 /ORGANISM="Togula jolla, Strain CCCM 725" /LENGTH=104 /DNA_ID=CAMNT_0010917851 /DNA_START=343 /DNA_END=653 /DNA_ORIENTATION=+
MASGPMYSSSCLSKASLLGAPRLFPLPLPFPLPLRPLPLPLGRRSPPDLCQPEPPRPLDAFWTPHLSLFGALRLSQLEDPLLLPLPLPFPFLSPLRMTPLLRPP